MPLKHLNLRVFLYISVGLAIILWAILLLGFGISLSVSLEVIRLLPIALSIEVVIWFLFARYFWRWRIFQEWLVPFPDLQGTWKGYLHSSWKRPNENETIPPKPIYLIIRHSFLNINCTMLTDESKSHSYAASLHLDAETKVKKLIYSYINRPQVGVRNRSEIHDGTASLEIIEANPALKLKGEYWTNRLSRGDIELTYESANTGEGVKIQIEQG